ncbi:ABC transporter ATP-binding protein [Spartinivicinus marinus]|nr:ABC transporter ATP-binding protein [Spartinivicinus marinus]MCX4028849.1 ABC transporter ATP-binding protein [Spartinivicinus marinus]
MLSDEVAVKVNNVSKYFKIYDKPHDRIKQIFTKPENKKYYREFCALNNISFEIKKGDTVGIIGRNGAGKSTLLQIICGTLTPTIGSVELNGKLAALLELGAGFNPEFTGRENIYLNGAILGLSKGNIDSVCQDIINFSELNEFIDRPVKTYSSGMYVRLGFSVAAHVNADILIIDEALSVGDIFFQQKCMRYLQEFKSQGGTLLFVSHDTSTVLSMCQKAIILFPGGEKPAIEGTTEEICKNYVNDLYQEKNETKVCLASSSIVEEKRCFLELQGEKQLENIYRIGQFRHEAESFGIGGARIRQVVFLDEENNELNSIVDGNTVTLRIQIEINRDIRNPVIGFMIKDKKGQYIYTEDSGASYRNLGISFKKGETVQADFSFSMPVLIRGSYTLNVAISDGILDDHQQLHWIHDAIRIDVLQGRLVHGYCGVNNLNINLRWINK